MHLTASVFDAAATVRRHEPRTTHRDEENATMTDPYGAAAGLVRVYPASRAEGSTDASAPRLTPGLVWAHGGGFVGGDLHMPEADWVARSLAARGVAVVSIDYRLVGDGAGRYPAGSDDVLAAWSWTLDHADELGVDSA